MSVLGGRGTSRADELLFSVGGLGERGEFDEFEADMFDAATATTAADATIWGGAGRGEGMGRADEPNTRGFRGQRRAFVFFRVVCVESAPARGGLIERRPRRHANRARVSPNKCSGSVSMPPQPFDRFHLLLSGLGAFAEFASGLGVSARQRTRFVPPRSCMRRLVGRRNLGPQMDRVSRVTHL